METMVKAWKEAGINKAIMTFSCGGDSMYDWNYEYFDEDHNEITSKFELEQELEDETFKRVEFYVNSDGHYMGESGTVEIALNDEEDDFEFAKYSESEWNENVDTEVYIDLNEEQTNFAKNYMLQIQGTGDDAPAIDYSKNFILTDELKAIEQSIFDKVVIVAENTTPDINEEVSDYFDFIAEFCNDHNKLKLTVTNQYYKYVQE